MPTPTLEKALLHLSDQALLHVVSTFLHGLADRSDDDLYQWCQALGFRMPVSQEAAPSSGDEQQATSPTLRQLLAPPTQTLRRRIERLSQVEHQALERRISRGSLSKGFSCRTTVMEPMSTALKAQGRSQDHGERDLEVLAVFTLLWAGERFTLKTKTSLFQLLQRLPIGSVFDLMTTCHEQQVSQGRYCLLLADSTFATGSATYAWFGRSARRCEQVVLERGLLALPGRKLIAVLQGDRHQLAFLEPLACEDAPSLNQRWQHQ